MNDAYIRRAVFDWLAAQVALHGDVLSWSLLIRGLVVEDQRIPLVSMQGIFTPAAMELPVSIRTAFEGPYADRAGVDGRFLYAYRGTDPAHPNNVGLRECLSRRIPLVYFFGILQGRYVPAWPVFVVGDDPGACMFTVQVDDASVLLREPAGETTATAEDFDADPRRRYLTRALRVRLHQRAFRERVLRAYGEQCALCRLRHHELLDAAHIIPDSEPGGEPRVPNGLSLCKLHHAAFDRMFIGVRPDYVVEVRRDILDEEDGPMLLHGLKGLHRQRILLPRHAGSRPDPKLLDRRYERFRQAPS